MPPNLQSLFRYRQGFLLSSQQWLQLRSGTPGGVRHISFLALPAMLRWQGHELVRNQKMGNQVVLITGGLTGIGRAAAVAFAKKGIGVMRPRHQRS